MRSEIDGSIQIKSYLKGNPEVRLALNEDLIISGTTSSSYSYGAPSLDDFNFHDCASICHFSNLINSLTDLDTQLFEAEKTLVFTPPEGEFSLMNYRMSTEFHAPFRVVPYVDEVAANRIDVSIKV